jgi:RNA polymerase sigma-70 factor (ECF subfamily)
MALAMVVALESFPAPKVVLMGAQREAVAIEARVRRMFDDHFDFVWRTLRRLGLENAAADDAAQEVFVLAARKLDAIAPERERSFLFGSAIRIAANARRRRSRTEVPLDVESGIDPASPAPLPDEQVESRQALERLDRALSSLPDDLRVVLVLTELDAMSQPAIAELLDLPVGTVASRLRRARHDLTSVLAAEDQEKEASHGQR